MLFGDWTRPKKIKTQDGIGIRGEIGRTLLWVMGMGGPCGGRANSPKISGV